MSAPVSIGVKCARDDAARRGSIANDLVEKRENTLSLVNKKKSVPSVASQAGNGAIRVG